MRYTALCPSCSRTMAARYDGQLLPHVSPASWPYECGTKSMRPATATSKTVTEWGIRRADGSTCSLGWMGGLSEEFARKSLDPDLRRIVPRANPPVAVIRRERTTYTDTVTDWQEVPTDVRPGPSPNPLTNPSSCVAGVGVPAGQAVLSGGAS